MNRMLKLSLKVKKLVLVCDVSYFTHFLVCQRKSVKLGCMSSFSILRAKLASVTKKEKR